MSEFLNPDRNYRIPLADGNELQLSPAYDVIHRFEVLGFNLLKYWSGDHRCMTNIAITDVDAVRLHHDCEIEVVQRRSIQAHEHEIYQDWLATKLDEIFGGEFDDPTGQE